jgi:hypothetical protein
MDVFLYGVEITLWINNINVIETQNLSFHYIIEKYVPFKCIVLKILCFAW